MMAPTQLLPSKIYIAREVAESVTAVYPELGAFGTETEARLYMRQRLLQGGKATLVLRPEFANCFPVAGHTVQDSPDAYLITAWHGQDRASAVPVRAQGVAATPACGSAIGEPVNQLDLDDICRTSVSFARHAIKQANVATLQAPLPQERGDRNRATISGLSKRACMLSARIRSSLKLHNDDQSPTDAQ